MSDHYAENMDIDFGVYVPNVHHGIGLEAFLGRPFPPGLAVNPQTFVGMAEEAERQGLSTLWFGDHVIFPSRTASPHPSSGQLHGSDVRNNEPIFDPLVVMTYLGALTRKLRLAISVLVIPYRNPVITAKWLATLDVLTGGRVLIGAGVGMMEEEFAALRAPFKDRGKVTDEYIAVMRKLWGDGDPAFEGEFYTIEPGLKFLPKPVHGTIPIWIGGNTKFALRRTARLGDGWLAVYQTPTEIKEKWATVRQLAEEAGRDPETITLAHQMRYFINDEDYPEAPPGVGSVRKIADDIKRFAEVGVRHIELAPPPGPTTEAILAQVRRFAEEVRPLL
jgi:probable F420-dependent oxidoreductase